MQLEQVLDRGVCRWCNRPIHRIDPERARRISRGAADGWLHDDLFASCETTVATPCSQ